MTPFWTPKIGHLGGIIGLLGPKNRVKLTPDLRPQASDLQRGSVLGKRGSSIAKRGSMLGNRGSVPGIGQNDHFLGPLNQGL
jgi:hypothetical protein